MEAGAYEAVRILNLPIKRNFPSFELSRVNVDCRHLNYVKKYGGNFSDSLSLEKKLPHPANSRSSYSCNFIRIELEGPGWLCFEFSIRLEATCIVRPTLFAGWGILFSRKIVYASWVMCIGAGVPLCWCCFITQMKCLNEV